MHISSPEEEAIRQRWHSEDAAHEAEQIERSSVHGEGFDLGIEVAMQVVRETFFDAGDNEEHRTLIREIAEKIEARAAAHK